MDITAQEAWLDRRGDTGVIDVPSWVREVVEEIAFQARADRRIDKRSGVSQRLPISVLENVASNAERRALTTGEAPPAARIADIYAALPAITGKFELEYEGELKGADAIAHELIRAAVANVFVGTLDALDTSRIVDWFEAGGSLPLEDTTRAEDFLARARRIPGLLEGVRFAGVDDEAPASLARVGRGVHPRRAGGDQEDRTHQRARVSGRRAARASAAPRVATNRRSTTCRRCRGGRRSTTTDSAKCRGAQVHECWCSSRVRTVHVFASCLRARVREFMKYRYGKFVPDLLDELDMDELMSKLSDLLLASGFSDPYFSGTDDERTMQALYDAILDALLSGGVLPDERLQELLGDDGDEPSKQRLEQLIKQIIERMQESGYVTAAPDLEADQARREAGPGRGRAARARRRGSRSPTRRSTFSASGRCATCSARSARAASAATTRAIWRRASRRRARPSRTSSATR